MYSKYIMGRRIRYFREEERKKAITRSKTKYMLNKEWLCPLCDNHNYTLAGKSTHLRTKKHKTNYIKYQEENSVEYDEDNSIQNTED